MPSLIPWLLLFILLTQGESSVADAQRISAEQAAKDTQIVDLRLVEYWAQSVSLTRLDIHLGYVEKDTRPGGGQYLCGASTAEQSQAAGEAIAAALSHLSDAALRKLGVKYVILCSRMLKGTKAIGSIPVPPVNLLMLEIPSPQRESALSDREVRTSYRSADCGSGNLVLTRRRGPPLLLGIFR
jgi:hypothetical protein